MLETARLRLTRLSYENCGFILQLLNEPAFRQFIGDKGVRSVHDARAYLRERIIDHYDRYGFGLYLVSLKRDGTSLGICGLVKREEFDHPDLGFAFLEAHQSRGYASESAAAVLEYARDQLGLLRLIAIVDPENQKSRRLLSKLGFWFEHMVTMPGESTEVCQYGMQL